jgi:hypothetical protein
VVATFVLDVLDTQHCRAAECADLWVCLEENQQDAVMVLYEYCQATVCLYEQLLLAVLC